MTTTKLSTDVIDLSGNTEALTIPKGNTGPNTTDTTGTCDYPVTATALYQLNSDGGTPDNVPDTCGTHSGTATAGMTYSAGKFGNAANLNGSIAIETPSIIPANDFSFSCWLNFNSLPSGSDYQLIYNINDTSTNIRWYIATTQGGKLDAWNGVSTFTTSSIVFTTNQWHHVVYTANSTTGKKMYVDGIEVFTSSDTGNNGGSAVSNNWSGFGKYYAPSAPYYLNAKLDQARIFPSALTASQITELYNETNITSTGARPSSPTEGLMRENTTTGKMEFYDGSLWQEITDTVSTYVSGLIPSANFNTLLYPGDGSSSRSITGTGFAPDFTWTKKTGPTTANYLLQNTVNGAGKVSALYSAGEYPAGTYDIYGYISSFDLDGVTYQAGTSPSYPTDLANQSGQGYVSWNWKAGGDAVPNSVGTNANSSDVSANVAAGFSIVKVQADGTNNTIGHGLGGIPELIISKNTGATGAWGVYSAPTGVGYYMYLNESDALYGFDGTVYPSVSSTTFAPGSGGWNFTNGNNYIHYLWRSIPGYSKIGFYVGNGSTTGPIIYTGFKPAWIMIKYTNSTGSWYMYDNKRSTTNPWNDILQANEAEYEDTNATYSDLNYLDYGFQLKSTNAEFNGLGGTYIYMTFSE